MALLTAQDLDKTIILQPDESIVLNLDEFKQSDKSITEYMHRNKTIIDEISAQISIDVSELITIQKIQQMATITSIQETISILNNTYGIDDLSLVFCALNDILMDFQFLNRLLAISQQESKKVENVCSQIVSNDVDLIVVDSKSQCCDFGEVQHAVKDKTLSMNKVIGFGQVLKDVNLVKLQRQNE
eukprot:668536_1